MNRIISINRIGYRTVQCRNVVRDIRNKKPACYRKQ